MKLAVFYECYMLYMPPSSFYFSHLSPVSSTLAPGNISGSKLVWSSIIIFPSCWISFPSELKVQIKPQCNPELNCCSNGKRERNGTSSSCQERLDLHRKQPNKWTKIGTKKTYSWIALRTVGYLKLTMTLASS